MPSASEISAAARRAGLATGAAELHGALCGWIAGGGRMAPDWLGRVFADPALPPAEGPLAREDDAYLERSGQLRMAGAVAQAIEDRAGVLTPIEPRAKRSTATARSMAEAM